MPELVLFVGLQAAGKTSFYRERFATTHVHVSKDLLGRSRNREARQNRIVAEALTAGRSVVLDNTHPSRAVRSAAIGIARALGVRVVGYYFESRLALSRERNASRPVPVPEVALRATAAQLERPALDEGFAALWYVAIRDGQFLVEPWSNDEGR